jgi:hypothetical protein
MEPISRLVTDSSTKVHGKTRQLHVVNLGAFRLPTGILAASDGFYPEPHRTAEPLPTAEGVLELAIGATSDGDQRVLAARIRYADSPIEDWYDLQFRGAKAISCDTDSLGLLFGESDVLPLRLVDPQVLTAGLQKNYQPTRAWAGGEVNGASFVILNSGMGPGPFYFYRGIAEDGKVAALLVDFTGILREGWE